MFDSMFSLNSPLGRALSRFADIIILNLLFVLCSIPIVTIGASFTALYTVMRRLARNEDGHIVKGFFQAFKDNFKPSTILWLILLTFGGLLVTSLYLTARLEMTALNCVLLAILLPYGIELSYVFPLVSQFGCGIGTYLRNAILLGIANFPWTILILLINLSPVLLVFFQTRLILLIPLVMLFVGFGLTAFCNCFIFNHIFKRYMPPAEDDPDDPSQNQED